MTVFLRTLGTFEVQKVPPQTESLRREPHRNGKGASVRICNSKQDASREVGNHGKGGVKCSLLYAFRNCKGSLMTQKGHHRRHGPHTGIPHAPCRPFPSWSACMVPCEGRPNTPASSSTDHPQSLTGTEVRSNHPSTSQTAMDRLQTEPAPLHTAARSTPIDRNLPTTKPHYSRR